LKTIVFEQITINGKFETSVHVYTPFVSAFEE